MPFIILLVAVLFLLQTSVFVFKEYERGVLLRLGRYKGIVGPGLRLVIPFIERVTRVDERTITMDVASQDVITRDNVSLKVSAVLYFQVVDAARAIIQVENFLFATNQLAQTTLRSVCGEVELDDLLSKRDELNHRIQEIVSHQTDAWGIKVNQVAIKHIDLPEEMRRAMAKQAEAEREKRAKVIQAEGEFQAAEKLTQAAKIMSTESAALQLRYLETLREISAEHNSTILFPIPIDIFETFRKKV